MTSESPLCASVIGPLPNNSFWAGTGSFCKAFNDGDPIALYDHDADRWIFTQFALFDSGPVPGFFVSHHCFAVSQTDDPTGAYFPYDFIYSVRVVDRQAMRTGLFLFQKKSRHGYIAKGFRNWARGLAKNLILHTVHDSDFRFTSCRYRT